jgi:hypothetical protein
MILRPERELRARAALETQLPTPPQQLERPGAPSQAVVSLGSQAASQRMARMVARNKQVAGVGPREAFTSAATVPRAQARALHSRAVQPAPMPELLASERTARVAKEERAERAAAPARRAS